MKMKSIIAVAILVPMIAGCTYTKTTPSRTFHLDANTFKCVKVGGKTHITIRDTIITDLLPAIRSDNGMMASGEQAEQMTVQMIGKLSEHSNPEAVGDALIQAIDRLVDGETGKIEKARQMLESCKGFLASEIKDT